MTPRQMPEFYHSQLAQRAQWAQDDYYKYLKARAFVMYGSPLSKHIGRNKAYIEFCREHYSWDGCEAE